MKNLKNISLFFLAYLLFACASEVDALRLKRRQEMDRQVEMYWERYRDASMRDLVKRAKMENNPEILQKGIEVRKKTKKLLESIRKDTATDIKPYKKWLSDELVKIYGKDHVRVDTTTNWANKYGEIAYYEYYMIRSLSGGECGVRLHSSDLFFFNQNTTEQVFEYDTVTNIACLNLYRYGYELDSLWIDGVIAKKESRHIGSPIVIPSLRAGKRTIRFKLKFFHRYMPEKDTTIFATHVFEVFPKKQIAK